MATHQASINIQEPTKFKLEATRIRVEYHFHLEPNSKQALKSERNSKTQLYKFEQELSKHPEFESEPIDLNHGRFCSSDGKLCNR